MIHLYLWVVLWIWDIVSHPPARLINEAKTAAQESFEKRDYRRAAAYYRQVVEASFFADPVGRLNMANAYFLAGDYESAYENYRILARVDKPELSAMAKSQLGMIALEKKDTAEALRQLREAILLNRDNASVVADFEILRSRFSGKILVKEPAKSDRPDPSPEPVEEALTPEILDNSVVELSDQREQLLQNLDRINMSEEQAKSILDAMKVNERQYIYQLRRQEARNGAKSRKKVEW